MGLAKEFPIEKMDGFRIGNAQNEEAGTGVTVVLFDKDKGARAGVDVSGGGPASRETPLASPLTADNPVRDCVLSLPAYSKTGASDTKVTALIIARSIASAMRTPVVLISACTVPTEAA